MPNPNLVKDPKDDKDTKTKLEEMRDNNRALNGLKAALEATIETLKGEKTALEAKLTTYDGIDVAEYHAMKARVQELGDLDPKAAKEAIAKVAELADASKREADLSQQLATTRLQLHIGNLARAKGFRPESIDYVISRAQQAGYTVDASGQVQAANGMDVEAWIVDPSFNWCHLPSKGGGSATAATGPATDARPVVNSGDALAFGQHLEGIAKGDVRVN